MRLRYGSLSVSLGDDSALLIDDKEGSDTLLSTDSIDPLFEVGHFKFLLVKQL